MVDKKVAEIERLRETERLKTELETIRRERDELLLKNEEIAEKMAAQSTIETYVEIAGKAAPILSAIFGSNPLIATAAGMLSGTGQAGDAAKPGPGTGNNDSENKTTVIELINEFFSELNDTEMADVYTVILKMQQDKSLIARMAHAQSHSHTVNPTTTNPNPVNPKTINQNPTTTNPNSQNG